jgi:hypothetical protein
MEYHMKGNLGRFCNLRKTSCETRRANPPLSLKQSCELVQGRENLEETSSDGSRPTGWRSSGTVLGVRGAVTEAIGAPVSGVRLPTKKKLLPMHITSFGKFTFQIC